jgi:hypothetical protein
MNTFLLKLPAINGNDISIKMPIGNLFEIQSVKSFPSATIFHALEIKSERWKTSRRMS